MKPEEHFFEVNAVKLHVLDKGKKEGDLIVFLHGFPEFWYGWKAQIEFFTEQGFRVLVPDQRGYNSSSKPKGVKAYCLKNLVEDIAVLIKQVTKKKVAVVGHDWGGAVAWHLALYYPQLVRCLTVINMPHPQVFNKTLKENPVQLLRSFYAGFFQLPFLPEWIISAFDYALPERSMMRTSKEGTFAKQDFAYYKKAWRQPGALTAMINWYRAYKYNTIKVSGRIELSTLLLWGKKDAFLLSEMAQPSIDLCANGKLVMVEDATHWIHHEQPHLVNKLIYDFLQEKKS